MKRLQPTSLAVAMTVAALFGAALFGAAAQAAEDSEHKFVKAAGYYTECVDASSAEFEAIKPRIRAFTDAGIMAETMNDHEKLFALMAAVNDPRTVHVMSKCAAEPLMWDTWLRGMTDPARMIAASARLMNPEGMLKWMAAPLNANVRGAVAAQFDAGKYTRWGVAAVNPTFYQPILSLADPDWYAPRLRWAASADTYAPVLAMFGMAKPAAK